MRLDLLYRGQTCAFVRFQSCETAKENPLDYIYFRQKPSLRQRTRNK